MLHKHSDRLQQSRLSQTKNIFELRIVPFSLYFLLFAHLLTLILHKTTHTNMHACTTAAGRSCSYSDVTSTYVAVTSTYVVLTIALLCVRQRNIRHDKHDVILFVGRRGRLTARARVVSALHSVCAVT